MGALDSLAGIAGSASKITGSVASGGATDLAGSAVNALQGIAGGDSQPSSAQSGAATSNVSQVFKNIFGDFNFTGSKKSGGTNINITTTLTAAGVLGLLGWALWKE